MVIQHLLHAPVACHEHHDRPGEGRAFQDCWYDQRSWFPGLGGIKVESGGSVAGGMNGHWEGSTGNGVGAAEQDLVDLVPEKEVTADVLGRVGDVERVGGLCNNSYRDATVGVGPENNGIELVGGVGVA